MLSRTKKKEREAERKRKERKRKEKGKKETLTLEINVVLAGTTSLSLQVALELKAIRVVHVVLGADLGGFWDEGWTILLVPEGRGGEVELVEDIVDLLALHLHLNARREQLLAGGLLDGHDAVLADVAGLDHGGPLIEDGLNELLDSWGGVGQAGEVRLVENEEEGLAREEGLNVVKEADLLLH